MIVVGTRNRLEEHGDGKLRIVFVVMVVFIIFSIIILRLFQKQVIEFDHYNTLAYNQRYREQKIIPARGEIFIGDIYSSDNFPLATNKTFWSVMIIPNHVEDPVALANGLGPILDIDPNHIIGLLSEKKVYIPPLKKKMDDATSKKIEALKMPGIVLIPESYRDYPEGMMGSTFLGFVNSDGEGQYGVEAYLNEVLKGKEGKIVSERDILGRQITVSDSKVILPKNGKDVVLTIDRVIQFIAEQEIRKGVESHMADSGSVVVIDPKSGGILAMAEWPSYDPAKYSEVEDLSLFRCMAVSDAYEVGSVFKPIAMAAGVDSGAVTPDSGDYFEANIKVQDKTIWNSERKAYGYETMTQVLENSDNVGMVWMIEKTGKDTFFDYFEDFGFGKITGVEVAGEFSGIVRDRRNSIPVDVATMSFGQGFTATELQMVQAMGAIANDGIMIQPKIVKEYIDKDGKTQKVDPKIVGRILKESSARDLGQMLLSVVERGHGKQARVKGYRIAGKTGTAQIAKKDGPGYEADKFTGSFLGYGPVENPVFAMVVRINVPKDVIWAESTAAPVFGNIAKRIIEYYQLPPDSDWLDEQIKRERGLVD